jgi:hypothetical protein
MGRSTVGVRMVALGILAMLAMAAGMLLGRMPAVDDYSPVPLVPMVERAVDANW